MDREILRRGLIEAIFVVLAGFSMGTLVVVATFADYGLLLGLDVGARILFVALATGVAIGLRLRDVEPQYLVVAGFVGASIAIVIVLLSVYAPVFAGVVPSLGPWPLGLLPRGGHLRLALPDPPPPRRLRGW